jgi:hypothetical protein
MSDTKTIYLAVTVPADFEQPKDRPEERFRRDITRAITDGPISGSEIKEAFYVTVFGTTDAIQKEAQRIKYNEYREAVKDVVDSVIQAVRDGEVTDRDEVSDRVFEECESACTYTSDCMLIVAQSNNDDAYFENAEDSSALTANNFWETLAFAALREDVNEELQRSDEIDVNEDDLGYFECEDCEKRFQRSAWESSEYADVCTECAEKKEEEADEIVPEAEK